MDGSVSILIPCYNAERWIAKAIESALRQTWRDKEIIVVDDGSADHSLDIIKEFNSSICWETGPNCGANTARNRLLELARGEWVQYLDADDYLLPEKIARQMEYVSEHTEVDIVFGPITLEHWSEQSSRHELLPILEPRDPWILLADWRLPQTGAPLWRKQAIFDVGGWNPDQPCCQEHELYLRLLVSGKRFAYHPMSGAVYRRWSAKTLCGRDIAEVHRRRLEIEQRMEDHLRGSKLLTRERLRAINQARFEIARIAWQYDSTLAGEIMDQVRELDRKFSPRGSAAPAHYRIIFHSLGFQTAQWLAAAARRPNSVFRKRYT
jgi:glycosyltransferase involved in cell wall biosynthesis